MTYPPCPTCGGAVLPESRSFGEVLRCQQCGAVRNSTSVGRWHSPPVPSGGGLRPGWASHGAVASHRSDSPFDLSRFVGPLPSAGFCAACYASTTDESPGNMFTFNFIGTRLLGGADPCAKCGSIVQRVWFCFILPVIPLDSYRVKYVQEGFFSSGFIGRKLR